jgi:cytochrome c-type biogenesis protein CcmH/NrfG
VLKTQLAPRTSADVPAAEATTEERIARLAGVVAERPDDVPARLALARMLLQRQDLPGALVQYDAASAGDPANGEALAYAGWIAVLTGNDQEGRARLDRAVSADPSYPDAHALRGLALIRAGEAAAAVDELGRYLELAPGGPLATQVQAVISRLEGPQ